MKTERGTVVEAEYIETVKRVRVRTVEGFYFLNRKYRRTDVLMTEAELREHIRECQEALTAFQKR